MSAEMAAIVQAETNIKVPLKSSLPGFKTTGLDMGAVNNNVTISNSSITPTNTPYAGYLKKEFSRINLDRLTFPKIYKPSNTRAQVDVVGPQSLFINSPVLFSTFDTALTDATGKAWTAVGNAQITNAQSKYGTGSLTLDGTGDYVTTPDSADFNFGTGDFTVGFWHYPTQISSDVAIFSQYGSATSRFFLEYKGGTSKYAFTATNTSAVAQYDFACTPSANAWKYVELVRSGTNLYLFENGVSLTATVGTAISTNTMPDVSGLFTIGAYNTGENYQGYIGDFFVLKGVALHTAAFSVPARQLVSVSSISSGAITLGSLSSSTTDYYKDTMLTIVSGTGTGQTRRISAYNGTTKEAALDTAFTTTPAATCPINTYSNIAMGANVQRGFDFSTIDYVAYPTINVIASVERLTGASASPVIGLPLITAIEKDWVSQAPVLSTNATTSYTTALSATGRVKLDMISTFTGAAGGIPWVRITIDGVVVFNDTVVGLTTANTGFDFSLKLESQSTMLIEHKSAGAFSSTIAISYSK